jgi:hypothetical protein
VRSRCEFPRSVCYRTDDSVRRVLCIMRLSKDGFSLRSFDRCEEPLIVDTKETPTVPNAKRDKCL